MPKQLNYSKTANANNSNNKFTCAVFNLLLV